MPFKVNSCDVVVKCKLMEFEKQCFNNGSSELEYQKRFFELAHQYCSTMSTGVVRSLESPHHDKINAEETLSFTSLATRDIGYHSNVSLEGCNNIGTAQSSSQPSICSTRPSNPMVTTPKSSRCRPVLPNQMEVLTSKRLRTGEIDKTGNTEGRKSDAVGDTLFPESTFNELHTFPVLPEFFFDGSKPKSVQPFSLDDGVSLSDSRNEGSEPAFFGDDFYNDQTLIPGSGSFGNNGNQECNNIPKTIDHVERSDKNLQYEDERYSKDVTTLCGLGLNSSHNGLTSNLDESVLTRNGNDNKTSIAVNVSYGDNLTNAIDATQDDEDENENFASQFLSLPAQHISLDNVQCPTSSDNLNQTFPTVKEVTQNVRTTRVSTNVLAAADAPNCSSINAVVDQSGNCSESQPPNDEHCIEYTKTTDHQNQSCTDNLKVFSASEFVFEENNDCTENTTALNLHNDHICVNATDTCQENAADNINSLSQQLVSQSQKVFSGQNIITSSCEQVGQEQVMFSSGLYSEVVGGQQSFIPVAQDFSSGGEAFQSASLNHKIDTKRIATNIEQSYFEPVVAQHDVSDDEVYNAKNPSLRMTNSDTPQDQSEEHYIDSLISSFLKDDRPPSPFLSEPNIPDSTDYDPSGFCSLFDLP